MKHHVRTSHHLLSQDFWGTGRPNNLVLLREKFHQSLHCVFDSKTPIQQIRAILELDKQVMNPRVYEVLSNTLKRFEWLIEVSAYEPDCIDKNRFYSRYLRDQWNSHQ